MKLNQKILSEDLFLVISIINYQIYIERGEECYLEIVVCMYIRILVGLNNLKLYFCYVNYIFINIVVNIIQKIKMKYIFIVYIGNV